MGPIGVLVWLELVAPFVARVRQVKTTADMQSLCAILQSYHERHGTYPPRLVNAVEESGLALESLIYFRQTVDAWGHRLLYETHGGTGFVLVSYGRDGVPDNTDYWWIRSIFTSHRYALEACRNADADIIASDVDFHRTCGK